MAFAAGASVVPRCICGVSIFLFQANSVVQPFRYPGIFRHMHILDLGQTCLTRILPRMARL